MCRISGIISKNDAISLIENNVKVMCKVMSHGGPDGDGIFSDEENKLVFGHNRLALLDLSDAGHQPMIRKNLIITFNGEIYNFLELKDLLVNLGYKFTTNCDTEVILIGYSHWGNDIFDKLEGMFAFALFDKNENCTYLVRDQSGIKPLYYTTTDNKLVFASEIKAFKAINYNYSTNVEWKPLFLAFGHLPEPYTTLKDVLMLPKASYLKWDNTSCTFNIKRFNSSRFHSKINDQKQAEKIINQELTKAVQKHLLADAPIGVFLSGGIDSSIITLLASNIVKDKLNTISINFHEKEFSEEKFQKIISEQTVGKHTSFQITETDFLDNFDTAIAAIDQPTQDGLNSWFVNKCAKENGLKAVLSGIGADELFGGYPSFKRIKIARKVQHLPGFLLRSMIFFPSLKLKRFYYLSYKNPIGIYLFLRGAFTPDLISKILDISKKTTNHIINQIKIDPIFSDLQDESKAAWLETNLYMQNQLLKDTDFMSMAHGLEVRIPFLDKSLLNTIQSIDNDILYKNTQPKSLLIESFKNILPKIIWDRPKMGFTFPFQKWLLKVKSVTDLHQYKPNKEVYTLMKKFKKGNLHWSMALILHQAFNAK